MPAGNRRRADQVGVVWEGWIDLAESGSWTFGLESDDGSRATDVELRLSLPGASYGEFVS